MQPKKQKRTRASHPKVRTGCHTCKARRVKCDEQRPSCQKCLNTGRNCEGYKNNREWVIIVAPPPPVTDGFEDDRSRRHFDYFRTQAVYELSWFFDGSYWGHLVLQESHASPAVRHAVIALACAHEDFGVSMKSGAPTRQYAYSAQHYNKAIRALIKETSDDAQKSRLRALMCGLLFISIEILRGNNAVAMDHLDSCLKIVREAQTGAGMRSSMGSQLESDAHILRDIAPMYTRLDTQASVLLGRRQQAPETPTTLLWDDSRDVRCDQLLFSSFESIFEALQSLHWLGDRFHDLTEWYGTGRKPTPCSENPTSSDVQVEKVIFHNQVMQWETAVQSLLFSTENTHDYDKLTLMRVHQRSLITLAEGTLSNDECALDAYHWAFEDIVNFTTELQEQCLPNSDEESSTDSDTSFSISEARSRTSTPLLQPRKRKARPRPLLVLDAGVVFSLYWTALKCRDAITRRRAISLLENACQEGLWIGPIQAAIAKRIVEIEEGQPYEAFPPEERLMKAEDVPGFVRVCEVKTDIMREKSMARVTVERGGEGCGDSVEWVTW